MRILGLDLSLTATGYAALDTRNETRDVGTIKTGQLRGEKRLHDILVKLSRLIKTHDPDLTVIEGYAYGRANQAHQLGELGGVVRLWLYEKRHVYVVIPPAVAKGFATGKGNASKDQVFAEAIRRLEYGGSDNNEADALWLATMATVAYGLPLVGLPKAQRAWTEKVVWPKTRLELHA